LSATKRRSKGRSEGRSKSRPQRRLNGQPRSRTIGHGVPSGGVSVRSSDKTSLYQGLAQHLAARISSGKLKVGDRLPTEAELGQRFGLSRITVRQALAILTQRGLIERFPHRGSFVKPPGKQAAWEMRSIDDLVQLGIETETQVLSWQLVPPPRAVEHFFKASAQVFRLRAVRSRASGPIFFAENYLVRRLGEELTRSDIATRTMVDLLRNKLLVPVDFATEDIEAGRASPAMAKHLLIAPGEPVLVQTIGLYDRDGTPLQIGRGWWRSDMFKRRYSLVPDR
jgi:GntR family transcriptional regulator